MSVLSCAQIGADEGINVFLLQYLFLLNQTVFSNIHPKLLVSHTYFSELLLHYKAKHLF